MRESRRDWREEFSRLFRSVLLPENGMRWDEMREMNYWRGDDTFSSAHQTITGQRQRSSWWDGIDVAPAYCCSLVSGWIRLFRRVTNEDYLFLCSPSSSREENSRLRGQCRLTAVIRTSGRTMEEAAWARGESVVHLHWWISPIRSERLHSMGMFSYRTLSIIYISSSSSGALETQGMTSKQSTVLLCLWTTREPNAMACLSARVLVLVAVIFLSLSFPSHSTISSPVAR